MTYQVLHQLGFRKIVDISFMIAFMFPAGVESADVEKYMNGLKRAKMDLDLEPKNTSTLMSMRVWSDIARGWDLRRFSTEERIVFRPYDEAAFYKPKIGFMNAEYSGAVIVARLLRLDCGLNFAQLNARSPQFVRTKNISLEATEWFDCAGLNQEAFA